MKGFYLPVAREASNVSPEYSAGTSDTSANEPALETHSQGRSQSSINPTKEVTVIVQPAVEQGGSGSSVGKHAKLLARICQESG